MSRSVPGPAKLFHLTLLLLVGACTSAGARAPALGDPDFITREEIEESTARNAYELVRNLRPQWLRLRGTVTVGQSTGEEDIVVYLDNARLGYRESMSGVGLASLEYLQFFSAREATQRWGGGHLNGAILISTGRR